LVGHLAAASLQSRRSIIERHIRRVRPDYSEAQVRKATQGAFDSYSRYYVESFRLPSLSADVVDATFTLDGFEAITDSLKEGNGAILALPHLGGWEWAGRWLCDQGVKTTVVVEALQPPELFEWFVSLRTELGMNVVPLGPNVAGEVLKALRNNEVVCLLCDRDLQGGGVPVDFFGETTTLPAGPVTLSLRTNAPVFPVAVYFTEAYNGHHAVIHPAMHFERSGKLREDVRVGTQALAKELEKLIWAAPEQWHLFQPNWPSDPGFVAKNNNA
jgi:KDO2-lipid IV(A) lauroyltransferase